LQQGLGAILYDVHTEGGEGVRLRWTHEDGGGGSSPMWMSTQKIKIRVLSSSRAKKLVYFLPEFHLWTE